MKIYSGYKSNGYITESILAGKDDPITPTTIRGKFAKLLARNLKKKSRQEQKKNIQSENND